jgi:hypothetical protein
MVIFPILNEKAELPLVAPKKSRLLLITTTISEATKGYSRDIAG